jgi:hypothetical protein
LDPTNGQRDVAEDLVHQTLGNAGDRVLMFYSNLLTEAVEVGIRLALALAAERGQLDLLATDFEAWLAVGIAAAGLMDYQARTRLELPTSGGGQP